MGISDAPGIHVNPDEVETNMVKFDVGGTGASSKEFAGRLLAGWGVRVSTPGPTAIRAIPYLGVSRDDVDEATRAICTLAEELAKN